MRTSLNQLRMDTAIVDQIRQSPGGIALASALLELWGHGRLSATCLQKLRMYMTSWLLNLRGLGCWKVCYIEFRISLDLAPIHPRCKRKFGLLSLHARPCVHSTARTPPQRRLGPETLGRPAARPPCPLSPCCVFPGAIRTGCRSCQHLPFIMINKDL